MADLNACRICLLHDDNEEFIKIFEKGAKIANEIFLVAGINILEFAAYEVPALICKGCLKDLKNAIIFRNRAISADKSFFRLHSTEIEEENFNKPLLELKKVLGELNVIAHKIEDQGKEKSEEAIDVEPSIEHLVTADYSASDHDNFNDDDSDYWVAEKDSSITIKKENEQSSRFQCERCPRNYALKTGLQQHMRKYHKVVGDYSCKECGEKFKHPNYLSAHQNKIHPKEHTCEHCGNVFPNREKWKRHLSNFHKKIKNAEGGPFPCSVCAKFFNNRILLRAHEKTHRTVELKDYYYCDLCDRKAKDKGDIYKHIRDRHLLKVRFHCPDCPNLSWGRKFQLHAHIKSFHQGIREFRCEVCGKEFIRKNALKNHSYIHTGEARFECKYCDKKFIHQTDCRRHEWSHTSYKGNIKCPNCNQGFIKNSDLQSHRCNFY